MWCLRKKNEFMPRSINYWNFNRAALLEWNTPMTRKFNTAALEFINPYWHVILESDFVSWFFAEIFQNFWRWKLTSIGLFWHSAQFIESFKSCPYLGWVKDGHFSFIQKSCQLGFILPPHPHFRFLRPCSVFHRGCRRILSGNSSIIWHPFLFLRLKLSSFSSLIPV